MSYVYIRSEPGLWTVGFYAPDGTWEPESDHTTTESAAARTHFLNGGKDGVASLVDAGRKVIDAYDNGLFCCDFLGTGTQDSADMDQLLCETTVIDPLKMALAAFA